MLHPVPDKRTCGFQPRSSIRESQPQSLADLAELTGRHKSNLSRTLKTMARYGLVQLDRQNPRGAVLASVPWEAVTVNLPLASK